MPPVLEGRVLTTGGVPLIYIFATSLWMLSENWIVRGSSGGSKTSWEAIGAALEQGNGGLELEGGLEGGEQIPIRFPSHKQQDLLMDYLCKVWKRDKSGLASGLGLGLLGEW